MKILEVKDLCKRFNKTEVLKLQNIFNKMFNDRRCYLM